MLNKLIKQGYKLYSITDYGYIYNWIWSLKKYRLEAILLKEGLTNIGAIVKALISTLLYIGIMIYIDNYFTSISLFKLLCTRAFRAVGTTRVHKAFPKELVQLKSNRIKLK